MLRNRTFSFTDRRGKLGCIVADSFGEQFHLRISPVEANRLLIEHGFDLPFAIVAKNYGSDDDDWQGVTNDDLYGLAHAERVRELSSWSPLEVWTDIVERSRYFDKDAARRISRKED